MRPRLLKPHHVHSSTALPVSRRPLIFKFGKGIQVRKPGELAPSKVSRNLIYAS